MATIQEVNGRYRAIIRKKDIDISATFEERHNAELWAKYKESLIEQISNFDPPLKEMISLQDAIELKIKKINDLGCDTKTLSDYKILLKIFEKFCHKSLSEISYSDLLNHFNDLMKIPVKKGGNHRDSTSAVMNLPAFATIFRKFKYLSTIYSMLIEDGFEIENIAIKVCNFVEKNK